MAVFKTTKLQIKKYTVFLSLPNKQSYYYHRCFMAFFIEKLQYDGYQKQEYSYIWLYPDSDITASPGCHTPKLAVKHTDTCPMSPLTMGLTGDFHTKC